MRTSADVYRFVDRLKLHCQERGATDVVAQLDWALHRGSSGLETLGAIRQVLIDNRNSLERLLDASATDDVDQVIAFVDKAYGR